MLATNFSLSAAEHVSENYFYSILDYVKSYAFYVGDQLMVVDSVAFLEMTNRLVYIVTSFDVFDSL